MKQEQYLESLRQEAAGGSEQAFLGCYLGHFCLVKIGISGGGDVARIQKSSVKRIIHRSCQIPTWGFYFWGLYFEAIYWQIYTFVGISDEPTACDNWGIGLFYFTSDTRSLSDCLRSYQNADASWMLMHIGTYCNVQMFWLSIYPKKVTLC